MNTSFLEASTIIMVAFFLGFLFAVLSGALFAYITFRTKREPHESLFKVGPDKGDAFVLDDFGKETEEAPEKGNKSKEKEDPYDPFPPPVRAAHERMMVQMAKEKEGAEG
jgi:hypothetical protein